MTLHGHRAAGSESWRRPASACWLSQMLSVQCSVPDQPFPLGALVYWERRMQSGQARPRCCNKHPPVPRSPHTSCLPST